MKSNLFYYAKSTFQKETHSTEHCIKFWSNQWDERLIFNCHCSRSEGLAILFNSSSGKVISNKKDANGH